MYLTEDGEIIDKKSVRQYIPKSVFDSETLTIPFDSIMEAVPNDSLPGNDKPVSDELPF